MNDDLKNKVDLNFIRYANCWEDAGILVQALAPLGTGKKMLSIASAGDNSLMLLTLDPALVVAVDLNPVQLYLTELKMAAIRCLERGQVLEFLGFTGCNNRLYLYTQIKKALSADAALYWDRHIKEIEQGIVHTGKFEKYFRFFSKKILPFIHTRQNVNRLLEPKTGAAQKQFYEQKWNNRRWRFFFRLFFSRYVMGKYGRDPEFLKEVKVPVATYVYQKAEKQLSQVLAQHNGMLHYQLRAGFGNFLPPYLREKNFEMIKSRLSRLVLFNGNTDEAIQAYGKFDGMNLSNIFEYMNHSTFSQAAQTLAQNLHAGGRICYWNLMVPRFISSVSDRVKYLEQLSGKLSARDKGFFYSRFIVEQHIV